LLIVMTTSRAVVQSEGFEDATMGLARPEGLSLVRAAVSTRLTP
jgi:hypothetical protein